MAFPSSTSNPPHQKPTNGLKTVAKAKFASDKDAKYDNQIVQIVYEVGDFISDGPKIPYARLRRFSKRARRELKGSKTWVVRCNHYEQKPFFDELFKWFKNLDNDVRAAHKYTGTDPAKKFPVIDKHNEWITSLSWKGLLLLDHSADYLHLREPLDNRKTRTMLFDGLDPSEFAKLPLSAEDLHLAYFLLQFKTKWLQEARMDPEELSTPMQHTNGNSTNGNSAAMTKTKSKTGTPSTLDGDFAIFFNGIEERNSSLIRAMVRRIAQLLLDDGDDALIKYLTQLQEEAKQCEEHEEEDNTPLIAALSSAYDWYAERRKRNPERKY